MAATSGASPPAPLAEIKLLFSATLSLTERLDKLEENPSSKRKGKDQRKGKRSSQEPQSEVPAKKPAKGCSRSTSEQNASDSEDCQKITQVSNESDTGSKDEILAEMHKEYEAEDSIGKGIQNPQLAKLLGKMFRSRLLDKLLKDKLKRQDRPDYCETVKPTRVNPGIWRKLREPTQKGICSYMRCSWRW